MRIAKSFLVSLLLTLGLQGPAHAVLISEGTSTFNVDLTAGLPFSFANGMVDFEGLEAGETLTVEILLGLNGSGGLTISPVLSGPAIAPDGHGSTTFSSSNAGLLDGLFSIRLTLDVVPPPQGQTNDGILNITSLTAYTAAQLGGDPILTVTPTPAPSAIPEPATLALLGLGLFGVAVARRRSH